MDIEARRRAAAQIAREAGARALEYFREQAALQVDMKGAQDFVSQADRNIEVLIRERLSAAFPDDAIVGEEHADKPGTSGFTWVIDPIDGTANFVAAIPFWCVAIAGVVGPKVEVGVIYDPNHDECFEGVRGGGAVLNGAAMSVRQDAEIGSGTMCVGSSRRSPPEHFMALLLGIVTAGGVFVRTGSGALGLAYVAAGRYLGYSESHMNAWDCLAGQLLIAEAGGVIEDQDASEMIVDGGRVIAGAPGVFDQVKALTLSAFELSA